MASKSATLIIDGNSSQQGLEVGKAIIGSGEPGRLNMTITSFKHQTGFADKPIVIEVSIVEKQHYFDDEHPVTTISYDNYKSKASVSTCTFNI